LNDEDVGTGRQVDDIEYDEIIAGNEDVQDDDGSDAGVIEHNELSDIREEEVMNDNLESEMDKRYGRRDHDHGLRPRRPRDFSHLHVVLEETVMTEFNMHRGIKEFGNDCVEAVLQELQQLHDRGVLRPVEASSLSYEDRQSALAYLMFLKQKRDGQINGRGCADGRKQRKIINNEDASCPHRVNRGGPDEMYNRCSQKLGCRHYQHPRSVHAGQLVHMKLEGTMAELLVKMTLVCIVNM
jgi:hypothetical protein